MSPPSTLPSERNASCFGTLKKTARVGRAGLSTKSILGNGRLAHSQSHTVHSHQAAHAGLSPRRPSDSFQCVNGMAPALPAGRDYPRCNLPSGPGPCALLHQIFGRALLPVSLSTSSGFGSVPGPGDTNALREGKEESVGRGRTGGRRSNETGCLSVGGDNGCLNCWRANLASTDMQEKMILRCGQLCAANMDQSFRGAPSDFRSDESPRYLDGAPRCRLGIGPA